MAEIAVGEKLHKTALSKKWKAHHGPIGLTPIMYDSLITLHNKDYTGHRIIPASSQSGFFKLSCKHPSLHIYFELIALYW